MSKSQSKCIIDNLSLESASILLEGGVQKISKIINDQYFRELENTFIGGKDTTNQLMETVTPIDNYFASLSNLINAIVLFDEVIFVKNGYENVWQKFQKTGNKLANTLVGHKIPNYIKPLDLSLIRKLDDPGTIFYYSFSNSINADLMLSPIRSERLINNGNINIRYKDLTDEALQLLDKQWIKNIENLESAILQSTLLRDVHLPSIVNYVLNKARSKEDIVDIAIEIKNQSYTRHFRKQMFDCFEELKKESKSALSYTKFLYEMKSAIDIVLRDLGIENRNKEIGQFGFNILFMSFAKNFYKPYAPYILFMRELVKHRFEINNSSENLKRLFY